MKVPIADVVCGTRYRQDLGDLQGLADSIEEMNLLHPIVVTPDMTLIAGQRRIEAYKLLGRDEIEATIVDLENPLDGEWAENSIRKDFTPSEAVAIGRALEEKEKEKAHERQRQGGRAGGQASGNLPQASPRTRDAVGKAVGMSGRTYELAKRVVVAAEEDPERFGHFAKEMDQTGQVHPAYSNVVAAKRASGETAYKGRGAVSERYETIRRMSSEGYRPSQIAAETDMSEKTVRKLLSEWGIETVETRVGYTKRIDATRIMEAVIDRSTPTEDTIDVLYGAWEDLDSSRFDEWYQRLSANVRAFNKIRVRLQGRAK